MSTTTAPQHKAEDEPVQKMPLLHQAVYATRLILVPMYGGLMVCMAIYAWVYFKFIYYDVILKVNELDKERAMLSCLEVIDMIMVMQLLGMILIGSFASFVENLKFRHAAARPLWLAGLTSGQLKVKMAMSVVGVSIISMVVTFVNIDNASWDTIHKKIIMHCVFIGSALVSSAVEWIGHISHRHKEENQLQAKKEQAREAAQEKANAH